MTSATTVYRLLYPQSRGVKEGVKTKMSDQVDTISENEINHQTLNEVEEVKDLYQEIAKISGIEYDEEEHKSIKDYKELVTRWFADTYPNTDEGTAKFEELPDSVQDWVNECIKTMKSNRGSRSKKPLPYLSGLDKEETVEEEEAPQPKRRGRRPKAEGENKEKSSVEKKHRGPNAYLRAMRALLANPDMSLEELSEKIDVQESSGRWCIDAFKAAKTAFEEAGYVKQAE